MRLADIVLVDGSAGSVAGAALCITDNILLRPGLGVEWSTSSVVHGNTVHVQAHLMAAKPDSIGELLPPHNISPASVEVHAMACGRGFGLVGASASHGPSIGRFFSRWRLYDPQCYRRGQGYRNAIGLRLSP